MITFTNGWDEVLQPIFEQPFYQSLRKKLWKEYQTQRVFPPMDCLFEAFKRCDYDQVKVVILGQDPYHGQGQAHGLAFSVQKGQRIPPSLQNIYKEISASQEDFVHPGHGSLVGWADQGVLLLNTILSVRESQPMSHAELGWQELTDQVIEHLAQLQRPLVFILWGAKARAKKIKLREHHLILESAHPSPLSAHRGFFGSDPFGRSNAYLREHGVTPINWSNLP